MITADNSHCEHIPSTGEPHDEADCPGLGQCPVADGLKRVKTMLDAGQLVIRRVQ